MFPFVMVNWVKWRGHWGDTVLRRKSEVERLSLSGVGQARQEEVALCRESCEQESWLL